MTKDTYNQYLGRGFQLIELSENKELTKRRINKRTKKCSKASEDYHEDMIYAVVPSNNIMIIDVDIKNGKQGMTSLQKLEDDLMMDLVPMVKTGSGGLHIYVTISEPIRIAQKDYPDIDFIAYKANDRLCTPYGVAGGQTITNDGKDYHYEMLSDKLIINEIDDIHDFLEVDQVIVETDDDTFAVDDLYEKKTPDEVSQMLTWLDASDYHEWMANASAIKRELGNTKEAFEIFNTWSMSVENYDGRESCLNKWKNVGDYQGQARTMGTLFMNAVINKTNKLISVIKSLDTMTDIDNEFNKMIWLEYPKLPQTVIKNEITKVYQARCQKLGEKMDYNESQRKTKILYGKDNVNEDLVAEIVDDDGVFFDFARVASFTRCPYFQISNGARHDLEGIGMMLDKPLISISHKLGLKKTMTIQQAFKKKLIQYATNHEYNPTTNDRLFIDDNGKTILNLFDPKTVPVATDITTEGQKLIRKFVKHLSILTSDLESVIFLDWMAYAAQNPGKKILWVPLIQSIEGVGKSLIGNLLINHVFGKQNAGVVDSIIIADKNNSWASSKMLRILEEIKLSGHNRYEVLNQLKPLITNPTVTRVEKFEVSSEVRNTCNFIAFTNFKDALPLDEDDRRWWLVFSPIHSLEHLEKVTGQKRNDYFEPLHELAKADSVYGTEFKRFLLDRNLMDFDPKFPPESKHKEELAEIERGKIQGVDEVQDLISFTYKDNQPKVINLKLLREAGDIAFNDNGKRITPRGINPQELRTVLKKLGYKTVTKRDYADADWTGTSPMFYHSSTVTIVEAVKIWKEGYDVDFIANQFDNLDDEL